VFRVGKIDQYVENEKLVVITRCKAVEEVV
jgi:hypothetical protein